MKASNLFLAGAVALALLACGQDYNSNSGDERFGNTKPAAGACDGEAGVRFCAAMEVIKNRCYACHSDWSRFDTSEKWVDAGRVTKGAPDSSFLYTKIINAGGDMPDGGSALPDDEFNAIKDWILKL